MDYDSALHETRTDGEHSETAGDFRVSYESLGAKMFRSYADKYADWVARGKPPAPSLPTHWVWPGRSMSTPLVRRLAEAQGGKCSLCGKPISFDAAHASRPTIEHVVPRSRGGGNHKNKLVAHSRCNLRKGSSMPTGCELVLLDAVNSRLFEPSNPNEDGL